MFPCSRSISNYEKLKRIGAGTYGTVYRAKEVETGELVAVKQVKLQNEKEGFPITALREIRLLQQLRHPNIVELCVCFLSFPLLSSKFVAYFFCIEEKWSRL
jgi:serine/threonine protein kinase